MLTTLLQHAQARILVQGKVTHLGYYKEEEDAARAYDRVSLAQSAGAATNFPASSYSEEDIQHLASLDRAGLQLALGVKPMQKSSRCLHLNCLLHSTVKDSPYPWTFPGFLANPGCA